MVYMYACVSGAAGVAVAAVAVVAVVLQRLSWISMADASVCRCRWEDECVDHHNVVVSTVTQQPKKTNERTTASVVLASVVWWPIFRGNLGAIKVSCQNVKPGTGQGLIG